MRQYRWVRFGISGLVLWAVAVLAILATDGSVPLPTVVLTTSVLVPVTWVMRAVEHDQRTDLSLTVVFHFIYRGVAGLLSSALVETWMLRASGQLIASPSA